MRWWCRCLGTAVRHALLEQARNRLALVLVVFFVPLWLTLAYRILPSDPVRFYLRAADDSVLLDANTVTQLSGGLHAIALIVGFMMFLATSRSAEFDHRLVLAGYPRVCVLLARNVVLLLTAALTAGYATAWVCVYYQPERVDVMVGALLVGALTYGGAGILLAAVLRSELAGMFVVIMVSFVDLTLQNPVANPAADSPVLKWLPAYGGMQSAVSAVDLHQVPWQHLLLGLCWSAGLTAAGLAAFTLRTGRRTSMTRALPRPRASGQTTRPLAPRLRHPLRTRGYRQAGIHDAAVITGYETCRWLMRRSGPMEAALPGLIPARLRPLVWAMYGYGRVVDDLSDDHRLDRAARQAQVRRFGDQLERDLRQGHSDDPVRAALVHAVWTWDLPTEGLKRLNDAYRLDAEGRTTLATWDDWYAYWHQISFPFGVTRLTSELTTPGLAFTPADADAVRVWIDALNLLDSLRDLREDAQEGLVRLPRSVLDEYDVSPGDLAQGSTEGRYADMVHAMTALVRRWLGQVAAMGAQHPPMAAAFRTLVDLHLLELERIERRPASLLDGRSGAGTVRFHTTLLRGRLRVARAWRRHTPTTADKPAPIPPPRPEDSASRSPDVRPPLPPVPHTSGARPPALPAQLLPRHVAIIMDGNGRWATRRGLPRSAGYEAGQQALRDVIYGALELGLPCVSVYALSTENWARPAAEIEAILRGLHACADVEREELLQRDVRMRWSGSPDGLPPHLVRSLRQAEYDTRHRTALTLNMCVNYGGRDEITQAVRTLARHLTNGTIAPDTLTSRHLATHLYQPELPDVDLLIRTGGEQRTSNFLPWQSSYAELLFLDTLWPDVDRTHLWHAIDTYTHRHRRFGAATPA